MNVLPPQPTATASPGSDPRTAAARGDPEAERRQAQLVEEAAQVRELASRDREVRAHEQAHAAAGGQHASAPRYEYERGPNGVNYAAGGHVNIDTSPVPGDPRATLDKARQIQRSALAPAEPSPQDRRVAAQARQMATEAAAELSELLARERNSGRVNGDVQERPGVGLVIDDVA